MIAGILSRWFVRLIFGRGTYRPRHRRRSRGHLPRIYDRRTLMIQQAKYEHRGYPSMAAFIKATSLSTIYVRDNGKCGICHRHVDRYATGPWSPSLDHIRPLARGGIHDPSNLQLAHLRCNLKKGTRRR